MKVRRKHDGDKVENKITFRRHFKNHETNLHKSPEI